MFLRVRQKKNFFWGGGASYYLMHEDAVLPKKASYFSGIRRISGRRINKKKYVDERQLSNEPLQLSKQGS